MSSVTETLMRRDEHPQSGRIDEGDLGHVDAHIGVVLDVREGIFEHGGRMGVNVAHQPETPWGLEGFDLEP